MGESSEEIVERWCAAIRTVEILEPWLTESHGDEHYWHDVAQLVVDRAGTHPDRDAALLALRSALAKTFEGATVTSNNGFYLDRLDQRLTSIISEVLES